mgnify:CR=1 FL=1
MGQPVKVYTTMSESLDELTKRLEKADVTFGREQPSPVAEVILSLLWHGDSYCRHEFFC